MAGIADQQKLDDWRLRIYIAGFLIALALHGLVHGVPSSLVAGISIGLGIALLVLRGLTARTHATGLAVWLILIPTLSSPLGLSLLTATKPIADTMRATTVWPEFLLCLIGSRIIVVASEIAFGQVWRRPLAPGFVTEEQSAGGALALGLAATLAFYDIVPGLLPVSTGQPTGIVISAMKGNTVVHGTILLTFFVILAFLVDAVRLHARDVIVLNRFRAAVRVSGALPSPLLSAEFVANGHTRAARMIAAALRPDPEPNATAYETFHLASRRFLRTLLPLLPLLGFLGTVIGLATAIADLPHGLSPTPGQPLDISGSLAGLAIKFETTLLGLLASMIASLALNTLEKHESELAASCLRVVEAIKFQEIDPDAAGIADAQI